jgi:hypothetical protein
MLRALADQARELCFQESGIPTFRYPDGDKPVSRAALRAQSSPDRSWPARRTAVAQERAPTLVRHAMADGRASRRSG